MAIKFVMQNPVTGEMRPMTREECEAWGVPYRPETKPRKVVLFRNSKGELQMVKTGSTVLN